MGYLTDDKEKVKKLQEIYEEVISEDKGGIEYLRKVKPLLKAGWKIKSRGKGGGDRYIYTLTKDGETKTVSFQKLSSRLMGSP